VCASLSDLDHLRKVQTEPTKVMMLDASHDVWYWEPTVRGSTPNYLPGMARLKGTISIYTQLIYHLFVLQYRSFLLGEIFQQSPVSPTIRMDH